MTVARILAGKGRDVVTTQPHRTLIEVARLLSDRRIGAVVVTGADREVVGIVSERDIVNALAAGGPAVLEDSVSRHMTAKVVTTTEDTSLDSLTHLMTEGRFRHVPVLREGRLAGIVSIGDAVKHRLEDIETEHRALREYIATA